MFYQDKFSLKREGLIATVILNEAQRSEGSLRLITEGFFATAQNDSIYSALKATSPNPPII
jgi:hypothetical protein